ncbi:MAG: type II secretion system F family protein, partial [Nanoarchaeota archaeon]
RALWYAVRPRFGVLANEIETVAKETMRGEDLKTALKKFADKFDSLLLKRCISLLIEGIEAGGEIGTLLNKIAINIDENRIMRQEMEANVTTYAIFISFATIAAAPVLFALSGVLIKVIANLSTSLSGITTSSSAAGFGLTFSGTGIAYKDFKIFAIVSLIITSFFSSVIIATIKKGNAKLGFKYIPLFIVITITLFLITDNLMGKMLGVFL